MKRAWVLVAIAAAILLAGQATARRSPGFYGKHHTRKVSFSGWSLSYTGSASWHVTETVSYSSGGGSTTDESSESQWHYAIPSTNSQAAGFGVTYPTPCRQFRSLACPQPQMTAVGKGPATIDFKANNSTTSGSPAVTDRNVCDGEKRIDTLGGASITAVYVRATDSYRISVANNGLPPELIGATTPSCPQQGTHTGAGGNWTPGDTPNGTLSHWFDAKTVTIPASSFASYSQIDIPISLLPGNAAPENCGLKPSPGATIHCKATGSWSGLLTLHRTAS